MKKEVGLQANNREVNNIVLKANTVHLYLLCFSFRICSSAVALWLAA